MRQVRVSEYGKKADGSCVGACLTDTETGRDIICPLTGNACTPDCAAFEINISANKKTKYACCYWMHSGVDEYLNIGELVEEAKP